MSKLLFPALKSPGLVHQQSKWNHDTALTQLLQARPIKSRKSPKVATTTRRNPVSGLVVSGFLLLTDWLSDGSGETNVTSRPLRTNETVCIFPSMRNNRICSCLSQAEWILLDSVDLNPNSTYIPNHLQPLYRPQRLARI